MSDDLKVAAEKAREQMQKGNPANLPGKTAGERKRIPLSVPQRKLEVQDIPGYHTHWFRGTAQRLAQAERAGFEYVHPDEVSLTDVSIGGDAMKAGNTDLGSRVSRIEGGEVDGNGQAVRMYLMKQKNEYWKEDQAILQERNDSIADSLTTAYRTGGIGGKDAGETAEDASLRYVDKKRSKIPELFRRKAPKPA